MLANNSSAHQSSQYQNTQDESLKNLAGMICMAEASKTNNICSGDDHNSQGMQKVQSSSRLTQYGTNGETQSIGTFAHGGGNQYHNQAIEEEEGESPSKDDHTMHETVNHLSNIFNDQQNDLVHTKFQSQSISSMGLQTFFAQNPEKDSG